MEDTLKINFSKLLTTFFDINDTTIELLTDALPDEGEWKTASLKEDLAKYPVANNWTFTQRVEIYNILKSCIERLDKYEKNIKEVRDFVIKNNTTSLGED